MVDVSVLDLVPVRQGQSTGQAIAASMALAKVADAAGCTRYWIAEDHNAPAVAATNPAVLIAMIAGQTQQLIVGSGGVMLPNHSPLVVAEQFALLEAVFPGRIDLGIGRAPGTDPVTSWALRSGHNDETLREFPSWVEQVTSLLDADGLEVEIDGGKFDIKATPAPRSKPPVWLLGSSDYSARLAAGLGLPYVFAHHFSGQGTDEALALYRDGYRGEGRPRAFVSVNVVVAESQAAAMRQAGPYIHSMAGSRTGQPMLPLLSIEAAERKGLPVSNLALESLTAPWLIGEPHQVAEGIFELADRFTVDEVMIHPVGGSSERDPLSTTPAREYAVHELASRLAGM